VQPFVNTCGLIDIDGHYLNLPVMNGEGEIVGMVDVLKLTYATLEQINTMNTGESEGPAWNKFWLSMDNDTESIMSGEGSHRPTTPGIRSMMESEPGRPNFDRGDSVMPHESASHHGDDVRSEVLPSIESPIAPETPFPFKFKAPSGRVHRIQVLSGGGVTELLTQVTSKLGSEVEAVGGEASIEDGKLGKGGYALSYLDNEGDTVSITTDQDLVDAIVLAKQGKRDKVDLFVHDPAQPPIPATVEPQPQLSKPPTPPESVLKEARPAVMHSDDDEEEEVPVAKTVRSKRAPMAQGNAPQEQPQIIAGVPNDLLLPGAIVTLAVVIVGVFAISRATSK
jgi:hypothetical protein